MFILYFVEALKHYRNKLTEFEQSEILDYPEIWYLGLDSEKVQARAGSAQNSGYDDENGSYLKVSPNLKSKILVKVCYSCVRINLK